MLLHDSFVDAKRILVVDDDELVRWALEREFESHGWLVDSVCTCAEAMVSLRQRTYRLVFLDIHLPDGDGLQLLRDVRRTAPDARAVVVSSAAGPDNKREAFAAGAAQFIEKPFELADVVREAESLFGRYPEKRRHARYRCRLPLRIAVLEPAPHERALDLHNLEARTLDVAASGVRLRTRYQLRQGQRIEVATLCKDDPCSEFVPSDAVARVVWVGREGDRWTAGLRYLKTTTPDRTS